MVEQELIETLAIIQARTSSKRLPEKVLTIINNRPILEWQTLRVIRTLGVEQIVMATSSEESDNRIEEISIKCGIPTIRGSLNDVFSRFIEAINIYRPKTVIRITGDCPLYMPELCEAMLAEYHQSEVDYLSNTLMPTYPDGCDIEIVATKALLKLGKADLSPAELEHVTLGIYSRTNDFKCKNFVNNRDDSLHRWTLDTRDDLEFISRVYGKFTGDEITFKYDDVMQWLQENPTLARYDESGMRSSGSENV